MPESFQHWLARLQDVRPRARSRFLKDARHHLVVSLLLASSFVVVEEGLHVLQWLDSMMLSLADALHLDFTRPGVAPETRSRKEPWHPLLIVFGDEFYETQFSERSPLDRSELTKVLEQIAKKGPKIIVVDLDLSPGAPGHRDPGQDGLDAFLEQERHRIVTITPFPVATSEFRRAKYDWMRKMCQAGVRFGRPDLVQTFGVVLKHSAAQEALANVAYRALTEEKKTSDACPPDGKDDPNAVASLTPLGESRTGRLEPINYRYFEDVSITVITPDTYREKAYLNGLPDLTGRVVFFGGIYGPFDEYLTPVGQLDGVMIHAAAFFTNRVGITPVKRVVAFVFEVLCGVGLGFLFDWPWRKYNQWRYDSTSGGVYRELSAVWFVVNAVILALLLVAVVVAGAFLLRIGYWLNPGPVILGMFLETLGARVRRPRFDVTEERTGPDPGPRPRVVAAAARWFKYGFAWALFLGAVWYLLRELGWVMYVVEGGLLGLAVYWPLSRGRRAH